MRYTVYRTTCLANGKVYVGAHKTENPADNYLGSGKLITAAIRKYGRDAFAKVVLHDFASEAEMWAMEEALVTKAFVARPDTYNLRVGGNSYRWHHAMLAGNATISTEVRKRCAALGVAEQRRLLAEDPVYRAAAQANARNSTRKAVAAGNIHTPDWAGRKHTPETKAKMSTSCSIAQAGERNSQYGTKWICKARAKPRKVPAEEVPQWEALGWHPGRSQAPKKARTRQ